MALTEKMIERAKELLSSRGRSSAWDTETVVKAYLEHGSLQKAADALGCSLPTVRRHVFRAIGKPGYGER